MPSLTRSDAIRRAELLTVTGMLVDLDLDTGPETFGSRTTIRFACAEPGAETFVDIRAREVASITLNGAALDPGLIAQDRLTLTGLAAENELVVEATMAYSRDGEGLHRASDPADGRDYVYGHLFLDAAPRVFACFDQPDLKAPYTVTVKAPEDWIVLGNGAASHDGPGRWSLAATKPLSTYFVTVCAGPYVSVTDEHDGIPLGVHARASLEAPLREHAPQIIEATRQSFDYYHELFGIRYPFGEYHQVFAPEFNAGAMENPGCVVLRDQYLPRGAVARDEILTRTNTVAHEMAHMWFGDLVTMQWWDDLWLNESFAEYMSHRTLTAATEFADEAWIDSTMARKMWGYAAERTPSTHPVAGSPAPDAKAALQNFDGISYAKGAATLRQLIAHVGDDAFVAGVRDHLTSHAFGNATLADFLGAMERASGQDLSAWSAAWLETAGLDTLSVDRASGTIHRTTPAAHPADRPHTLDVAAYRDGEEELRETVRLEGPSAEVPGLSGDRPSLILPNASDLTWASVDLDDESVAALASELPEIADGQARAVAWATLLDSIYRGTVDPAAVTDVIAAAWAREDNESVLGWVGRQVSRRVIPCFLTGEQREGATRALVTAAGELLERAEPGSGRALVAARLLASTGDDVDGLLLPWSRGERLPAGLDGDADFRWIVLRNLAARGGATGTDLDAALAQDPTMSGQRGALTARAALPSAEDKAAAWADLTTNRERSNYECNAIATGFWDGDEQILGDYVARYVIDVPAMTSWMGDDAMSRVATLAYPARIVTAETLAASRAALAGDTLTPGVRRAIVDCQSELEEALASRERYSA
ncbi:aminopeptidase N [Janibacter sp. G1551]|uniref:aminopeptidase N n=1 Tax=Janibacter sp. G1551 TaxID=3420440 RepID=UPI003CFBDB70